MNILLYNKEYIENVLIPTLEQHYGFRLTNPKYVEIYQDFSDTNYTLNDDADRMPDVDLYFGELTIMTKPKVKKNEVVTLALSETTATASQNSINTQLGVTESYSNFDGIESIIPVYVSGATTHKHQTHIHFTRFIDTYIDLFINSDKILTVKPQKEFQTLKFENVAFNAIELINGEPEGYIKFHFKGYRFRPRA